MNGYQIGAAVVLALVAILVVAIIIYLNTIRTNPIRVDIVGAGSCPVGAGDCRRVGVIQVVPPATARPVFSAPDFPAAHSYGLGSDHVVLPGCGDGDDVGYYAYAHPQSHGRLDSKEGFVLGGVPQQHSLTAQSAPAYLEFEGVKHLVMVSTNLLNCDDFEGQVVKVKP